MKLRRLLQQSPGVYHPLVETRPGARVQLDGGAAHGAGRDAARSAGTVW